MADLLTPSRMDAAFLDSYSRLEDDCALFDLTDRSAIVRLTGEDRKAWLQGQVTSDLRPMQVGGSAEFCLCSSTGHLQAVCRVWHFENESLVVLDRAALPNLLERCQTMIVMEDVHFEDVTPLFRLLTVQGPAASQCLGSLFSLPTLDAGFGDPEGTVRCLRAKRTLFGGWDLLIDARFDASELLAPVPVGAVEAYDLAALEAGNPRWGVDNDAKTLPPEFGPSFEARHVSYHKGCYTGQEVLMRIHARGHTNRTWVSVLAEEPLEPGDALFHLGKTEVGTIRTAHESPRWGFFGTATVRNQAAFEEEAVQVVRGDRKFPATSRLMPLSRLD
ncbi:MAG: hypothetical protein U0S12_05055 [Fimbriimonadales bacterium]